MRWHHNLAKSVFLFFLPSQKTFPGGAKELIPHEDMKLLLLNVFTLCCQRAGHGKLAQFIFTSATIEPQFTPSANIARCRHATTRVIIQC